MAKNPAPSRGMISGELSWAVLAILHGLQGTGIPPFGSNYFYTRLAEKSSPELWVALLIIPAIMLLCLGIRELYIHRRVQWAEYQLLQSSSLRGRACLGLIIGWMYMLKVLLGDLQRLNGMGLVAFCGVIFMWWFYKENRRVRREIRKNCASNGVPVTG